MVWAEALQGAVLLVLVAALALFARERSQRSTRDERSIGTIFSNPYLRLMAILAMLLIVLIYDGTEAGWIPGAVVLIVGATVAGADFVLLLVALIKGDKRTSENFVREHYALETRRLDLEAATQVVSVGRRQPFPPLAPAQDGSDDAFTVIREQAATDVIGLLDARTAATQEVRVAIVSAGMDPRLVRHPLFGGRVETHNVTTSTPTEQGMAITASNAALIAATVPGARLLAVQVFDDRLQSRASWLLAGVQAALAWDARVVLLDFGVPVAALDDDSGPLVDLLRTPHPEVVWVAPAGNDGTATAAWPGVERSVLGVAALDETGVLASFSNRGAGVELAAPGTGVLSLHGVAGDGVALAPWVGTSIAAGLATSALACLLATVPGVPAQRALDLLVTTGRDVPAANGIRELQVAAALGALLAERPQSPPPPAPRTEPNHGGHGGHGEHGGTGGHGGTGRTGVPNRRA